MIYFTSDTHFGSERTLKLSFRPFKNIEKMDEKIIKNWNKIVKKYDTVYHLGDFGNYDIVKKLNGKIILILGNYEMDYMLENFENNFQKFSSFLKSLGFFEVIKNNLTLDLSELNEKVFLTHEPIKCKKDMFNLFGHIHEKCKVKKFGLNVGIDNYNFKPASLEVVKIYKYAIQNHYDINVFCSVSDLKD